MSNTPLSLGIDFGGTSIKIGVVRGSEILTFCKPILTPEYETPSQLIKAISESVKELQKDYPGIVGIGVGVPGFVNLEKGLVYQLTNVPGWVHVPLRDQLQSLTGLPCTIENDANCMAYAEWKHGAGQGMEHLLCLTLGTGVGSGIISNNMLLHGSHSTAGELGQTSIHYRGRKGAYGNLGALEDYIGHNEITADAIVAYADQGITKTKEECGPYQLQLAAEAGDTVAIDVWRNIAEKLACAIVNACWLLNPEAIIIGGGVAKAGALIFDPLETFIRTQLSTAFYSHLKIFPAHFSNDAGIIGAATLGLENAQAEK
ncbi:ROK family protein [Verrucomicrobiaceae bacterium N1E253]|uniref:ROK family protein n=1 Tax=Oceaniferula marina TaxID=2748318 RepID=A0A851GCZ9_9BACT|nr:ROK family protein [Oceaniferula marina]NWK55423.1 ROK family protein [Oceaniferula marina]